MKRLLQLAVLTVFIAAISSYIVYFGLTNPRLEKLEKKSQGLINRLSLLKPQVGLNTEELETIKEMIEKKVASGSAGDNFLLIDEDAETLDGYDSTAFALAHLHPYLNLSGGLITGDIIWNSTQTFGNATLANLNELVSGASTTLHTHPGGGLWADNTIYIYPTNVGTSFQILDSGGLTVAGPINGATTVTAAGLIAGGSFSGEGSALTSLNASNLSSGTVPSGRISGSYTGITGLGTITTGTWQGTAIADTYLADNLTISGGTINNTPIGAITPSTGAFTTGSFLGQAAFNYNLGAPFIVSNSTVVTNLNADLLDGFQASDFASAGTYVSLQATTPGTQQTGNINVSGTVIGGTFSGSGASLTSLNASNLSSGTVPSARISGSYTGISGVGTITTGTWNADVIADAYIANDLTISGGTINSTPIGATTPSTGAFTAVTSPNVYGSSAASGNLNLYSTSDVTKGNIYLNVATTYIDSSGNLVTAGTVDGVDVSVHAAASSGVHGVTGSVVGTSDTQTLTNKTLSTNSTWNGNVIGLTYGGTGANLTAASGGIVYSGASALAISAAGTSGQLLVSGGAGAPSWTSSPSVTSLTASTSVSSPSYTGTGAVTLSSGGTSDLTLDAAGSLVLADANIDLTGGTTVTLRRNSATSDILALDNIGAGSLSLNLADGALQTAGVTRISNAGAGTLTSLDLALGGITNAGSITGVGANISGTGTLTLASGGAGQLTLDSASGTVALATGDSLSVPGNLTVSGTSNVIPYIYGSTAASGNLTLESTSNATKGYVILQPNGGNVGIGTASPGYKLEIAGGNLGIGANKIIGTNATAGNALIRTGSGFGASPQWYFRNEADTAYADLILGTLFPTKDVAWISSGVAVTATRYSILRNNDATNQLQFNVPTGAGFEFSINDSGKVVIDSSGNVGIGTTAPSQLLHIRNPSSTAVGRQTQVSSNATDTYFEVFGTAANTTRAGITMDGGTAIELTDANRPFILYHPAGTGKTYFANNNVVTMILDNSNNVGIGTTTPSGSTTAGTSILAMGDGTAPVGGRDLMAFLYSDTVVATTEMFVMDEAGNATQISPHDPVTGEWIFSSQNLNTGKTLRVEMERLTKDLDKILGGGYVFENGEPYSTGENLLVNLKKSVEELELKSDSIGTLGGDIDGIKISIKGLEDTLVLQTDKLTQLKASTSADSEKVTQLEQSLANLEEVIAGLEPRLAFLEAQPENQTSSSGALTQEQEKILAGFTLDPTDGHLVVKGDLEVQGHLTGSSDIKGQIIVKAGETTKFHSFQNSYRQPPVVTLTPTSDPGEIRFWVNSTKQGFTLNLSQAPQTELTFNYIVIE